MDPKGSRYQADFSGKPVQTHPYLLEGVGQDFLPGTLALSLLDEVVAVEDQEAFPTARRLALEEGILAGGSAGNSCITEQGVAEMLTDFDAAGLSDSALFGELKVKEIMGLPLPTVQLRSNLGSPLGFFREQRAVLVLDGRNPGGILTLSDVVHYLLKN